MNVEQFLRENLKKKLTAEGLEVTTAVIDAGVDHYRRYQAIRKGDIFNDCLYFARQFALKKKK